MSSPPAAPRSRIEVATAADLADAGYVKAQLAEEGIRAWLRAGGEEASLAQHIDVEPEDAERARALLDAWRAAELQDVAGSPEPIGGRGKARRVGLSFLTFLFCLRLGTLFGPVRALGLGVVAATLCFHALGGDPPGPSSGPSLLGSEGPE